MTENIVVIGDLSDPIASFRTSDHRILDIVYSSGVDVIGSELSIDEIDHTVRYMVGRADAQIVGGLDFDGIASSDEYILCTNYTDVDLRELPYGTKVTYLRGGNIAVKAYLKSVTRTGKDVYRINAVSAIGLLDKQKHLGGMYTGQTMAAVIAEIIDGSVPYTMDEDVAATAVYEWLPIGTKRENLHKVLFANGVMVGRNTNGDMRFRFISNAESVVVPERRVYDTGGVEYPEVASEVQVAEHSYTAQSTDETVKEYDNTEALYAADHTLVEFQNAPLHDLTVTGTLVIEESGVNYAIVSGVGTLSGKKYNHTVQMLTGQIDGATEQRVVTVDKCTVISSVNSAAVLQRLIDYYSTRKIVSASFVLDGEKAGDMVTLTDPFGESVSGFVSTLNARISGKLKADAKIIAAYTPHGSGNYSTIIEYDTSQTIDLAALLAEYPDKDNDRVKLVLIGGGNGGKNGGSGGGAGGNGGLGGKVYEVTVNVGSLEQTVLALNIGQGGESNGEGTATTFGAWSSADGNRPSAGVANIFTGAVYAKRGENGVKGGAQGQSVTYKGQTWRGGSHTSYTYTTPYYQHTGRYWKDGEIKGSNGYGGGAAVGNNGYSAWSDLDHLGYGGDGGNAINGTDATVRGCGGNGGHGGGAGGAGGRYTDSYTITDTITGETESFSETGYAEGGLDGTGGAGGRGGDGLLMIYV